MAEVQVRLLPMGDTALLAEVDGIDSVLALVAALRAGMEHASGDDVLAAVEDVLPAARTVLVSLRRGTDPHRLPELAAAITRLAARLDPAASGPEEKTTITLDVDYAGPDLAEVARLTGLSQADVVAAHTGTPWRVAFAGFAPGFAYLVGGDPRLQVPRRSTPRTSVPAGSVGLAGEFSGVYPSSSPGGWQLIGRTDAVLWDVEAQPPALLRPGDEVRFRAVRTTSTLSPGWPDDGAPHPDAPERTRAQARDRTGAPARVDGAEPAVEVLATGPQVLVQDDGRPGLGAMGVGRAGAADRSAYELGNRLLGNRRRAASLEILYGGLRLRARGSVTVCLTGAPAPATVTGLVEAHRGTAIGFGVPVHLPDGAELTLAQPRHGLRTYLAVRGGIDVAPVLGSRSTDIMSGLGPAPVQQGVLLPVGRPRGRIHGVDQAVGLEPTGGQVTLHVTAGPRRDWFERPQALTETVWTTSQQSNRVGIRLEGEPLTRVEGRVGVELPSEGMVRGAIQVPPDGRPVIFLNDHPLTGGYPVIGVVSPDDVDRAAQLQPGQRICFRWRR